MRMIAYIMCLFGISIAFYLAGYQPLMWDMLSETVGTSGSIAQTIINSIYSIFTNPLFLAALGISAITSYLLSGSNFSVFFIIPLLMLVVFANIFILPSSYLFDTTLPTFVRGVIAVFFNIFMLGAILQFVGGRN